MGQNVDPRDQNNESEVDERTSLLALGSSILRTFIDPLSFKALARDINWHRKHSNVFLN